MKNSFLTTIYILLPFSLLYSQIVDSFSDNNFTANPVWAGDTEAWNIVLDSDVSSGALNSYSLRLNGPSIVDQTDYLYSQRQNSWGDEQSWGVWLGRRQRGIINNNYSTIWLWADGNTLKTTAENGSPNVINGYRIKFGRDIVEEKILLQKLKNGVATTILYSAGSISKNMIDYGFLQSHPDICFSMVDLYLSSSINRWDRGCCDRCALKAKYAYFSRQRFR